MKRTLDRSITAVVALAALLCAGTARAEVGTGTSSAVRLDVLAPEIDLVLGPVDRQYRAGQLLQMIWSATEDHPSPAADGHTARILRDGVILDQIRFADAGGPYAWNWTVPELSLGDVYLEITVTDQFGNSTRVESDRFTILSSATGVDAPPAAPLLEAAPNPFNPSTRIRFASPRAGDALLEAYDLQGRRVRTLFRGAIAEGEREVAWNGRDDAGRILPAGSYLLRFVLPGHTLSRKVVLLP